MNLNLKKETLRKVNETLQSIDRKSNKKIFKISNPDGNHAICAGLKDEIEVTIDGHTGYYCAGMNMNANIIVNGNVGTGVAENMSLELFMLRAMHPNQLELQHMVEL